MERYRIYRWLNGVVMDTFEGNRNECEVYCKKWEHCICEWTKI